MQGELNINKRSVPESEISDNMILARCSNLTLALDYCIEISPYDRQQVAFHFGWDIGHLNRQLNPNDKLHFDPNNIDLLMTFCENTIPLRYQALKQNFGLHRLKSALELENECLRRDLEEKEREHLTILKVLKELKG
jgi:hypothetical protein